MKAHTTKPRKGIVLSIGMIVKNEEKNLARSLDSLKPLMAAVPCELIIADTGSTDATMEIASRYTKQVYSIPWTDDFSAARNTTVERATGEWYMYLDADNWFVDLRDMIAFFCGPLRNQYNCAAYTVYNFTDAEMKQYKVTHDMRVIRRTPDLRFYGRIHEHLPYTPPCCQFKSLTYHTGYVHVQGQPDKVERNLPLLLRSLEDPGADLAHVNYQLAREYGSIKKYREAEECQKKGIAAALKTGSPLIHALRHDLAVTYYAMEELKKLVEAARAYLADAGHVSGAMDVQYMLARGLQASGQYAQAAEAFGKYFALYNEYSAGKLDDSDRMWVVTVFDDADTRKEAQSHYVRCLMKAELYEKALETLPTVRCETDEERSAMDAAELECVIALKDAAHYHRRFSAAHQKKEWNLLSRLCDSMEALRQKDPELGAALAKAFAAQKSPADDYADFMRLRATKNPDLLAKMLETAPPTKLFAEMVAYAMEQRVDFEPFARRVDTDDLAAFFEALPEGIVTKAADYYKETAFQLSPRGLRWKCALLEKALLSDEAAEDMETFRTYCQSLGQLVSLLYGAELPDEQRLSVIPHAHRFGYYACAAYALRDQGDTVGFLRELKKAGETYPVMLDYVKRAVKEIEDALERERDKEMERTMLYIQIKEKIRALIQAGDTQNAAQILDQYAKVNPKDEAIPYLLQQLSNPVDPS